MLSELLKAYMDKLGLNRLIAIGGIILGTFVFATFLMMRASAPEMALLFANVDPGDGAKILERLKLMNVPTEVRGEGDQIYVPYDRVSKLRMELASDGLPAGGTIGYELFDKTDMLGTTNALMDINLMRAIEGELSKSIKTIQGVQSARVHLVIPKRELFSTDKMSPSASILIKMKGASRLSVNQVLSIQHLVASAVTSLSLDRISIIDDKGTLLAKGQDSAETGDTGSSQQEQRHAYEAKVARSIESLLERTVGAGKIRAEVTAEMNFDKITSTSVDFNPDGQVARSQQSTSEGSNSNESAIADAVTVQNAQPDTNAGQPTTQSKNQDTRTDESTTFEISNTTKTHIHETGTIQRLSIAVLVDGVYSKDKDGKDVYTNRTEKEIAQLTELVKTAVGFQEKRGDTVKVINMAFNDPPEEIDRTTEFTKWMNAIFTPKVVNLLILLGFGLLLYLTLLKPLTNRILLSAGIDLKRKPKQEVLPPPPPPPPPPAEPDPTPGDEFIDMLHIDGKMKTSSVKKIGEIIEQNPEEAINILRGWMYSSDKAETI